jgi:hypothetical protein
VICSFECPGGYVELKEKRKYSLYLLSAIVALISGLAVSGLVTVTRTLSSSGTVNTINVEVFWDVNCTQIITDIDWGVLDPGENTSKTIYIKNTGSTAMTLNMTYSGWNPVEAGTYLSLTWDREGVIVAVDEVVSAVLTLHVSDIIAGITSYSFDITIAGSA